MMTNHSTSNLNVLLDNRCIAVLSVLFAIGFHKLVLPCIIPISYEINLIIIIIIMPATFTLAVKYELS